MANWREGRNVALLSLFLLLFAFGAAVIATAGPGDKLSPAEAAAKKRDNTLSLAVPPAQESEYVGGADCLVCHDIEQAFAKNPHYKTWKDESLPWSERGCETCHGPGRAHIDAGGDPDRLFNFKKVSPQQISDRCLDCHLEQEGQANFLRNEHGLNTVACTDCHSIHSPGVHSPLLKARSPALCYNCHGEVRVQFNKPFHHKVNEGLLSCTDCHQQHGGFERRQLRTSTGGDFACYECHADKQGPFVFEHPPVKVEGCAICHDVHGSVNPRLLKRSEVRFLCLECHSGSPNAFGDSTPFFHDLRQAAWQNCTTCHVNIHGSNLSPVFFE
ncbi:MAG: DmsE family decaheme c-type cytochrome [Terriglobia bacterium]